MQAIIHNTLKPGLLGVVLVLTGLTVPQVHAQQFLNQDPPGFWAAARPETDFERSLVPFSEIFSGGPPKDGIPAIDTPDFEPVGTTGAAIPAPTEPVMSVAIAGDARAYPLRILIWHEIVNDTVGGVPVAVTFCPLCNSAVMFDRRVEGAETTFGTTGRLRNSDLVMYDRATESWWQQFEGRAIVGSRAGTELTRLPARLESYAEFAKRHPGGRVLVPNGRFARDYGRNPYVGYDSSAQPFLYAGAYSGPGRPLMRVVSVPGVDAAWSLELLRAKGEIRVPGAAAGDLVLRWTAGLNSALDQSAISEGRDVGTVTVQKTGASREPEDVPYDVPFAFAFSAFHPGAPIHHVE
ncbi:DUF3179 domain-containing protein [Nisaea sp.]|uniref:DUF3179 domain-containing protein n=1 Tax=Nisaea sp. TaxID=2024842 RepID=UPI003B52F6D2